AHRRFSRGAAVGGEAPVSPAGGVYSETAAASDPTQPAPVTFLAGSNVIRPPGNSMGAFSSADAGVTWSTESGPTGDLPGGFTSDPSVAFSPSGLARYYSYISVDSRGLNTDLRLATSVKGGAWSAVTDPRAVCPDKPLLAVDQNPSSPRYGWIYVAYDQNLPFSPGSGQCPASAANQPVYVDYSADGGRTWKSSPVFDNGRGANIGAFPVVAADGSLYVAWDDYGDTDTGQVVIAKAIWTGGTSISGFTTPAVISPTASGFGIVLPNYAAAVPGQGFRTVGAMPALAADPTDPSRLYAAWADTSATDPRMHIHLSRSTDGGATWSEPVRIDLGNPNDAWQPALAVDGTGSPHTVTLAWYDRRDDPGNHYYRIYYTQSTDGGQSFLARQVPVSSVQSDPTLDANGTGDYMEMVAAGGHAHPVWTDTRNGSNQIFTAPIDEATAGVSAPADYRTYLAEGTTRAGFQEYVTLENPTARTTTATITLFPAGSPPHSLQPITLPPHSRFTENVNHDAGPGQDVSVLIDSPSPDVLAERPMYFNACPDQHVCVNGGDVAKAAQPAFRWDFAEGTTRPGFIEFLTLLNPTTSTFDATVAYSYGPGQSGPASKRYALMPGRTTITVNSEVGGGKDVSIEVLSPVPVVVERPIYFNACVPVCMNGGDVATGSQPQPAWNFAEGTTRPGFDEYLTLLNTGPSDQTVDARYFFGPGQGSPVARSYPVPAGARVTVLVNNEVGPGKDVSVQLSTPSASSVAPTIVAERPLYFNACPTSNVCADGGDVVAGAASDWPVWSFSEGTTRPGFAEFLTVENPGTAPAIIDATYNLNQGAPIQRRYTVGAGQRLTITVNSEIPAGLDDSVTLRPDPSNPGAEFVVERPMYFATCAVGVCARGGSDAVGFPVFDSG
ncbi:MAG: sialidase family protein, partial [Acidimicrobiales bacterium]